MGKVTLLIFLSLAGLSLYADEQPVPASCSTDEGFQTRISKLDSTPLGCLSYLELGEDDAHGTYRSMLKPELFTIENLKKDLTCELDQKEVVQSKLQRCKAIAILYKEHGAKKSDSNQYRIYGISPMMMGGMGRGAGMNPMMMGQMGQGMGGHECEGGESKAIALDFASCKTLAITTMSEMATDHAMNIQQSARKTDHMNKSQEELKENLEDGSQTAYVDMAIDNADKAKNMAAEKFTWSQSKSVAYAAQLGTFVTRKKALKKCSEELDGIKTANSQENGNDICDEVIEHNAGNFFPNGGAYQTVVAKFTSNQLKAGMDAAEIAIWNKQKKRLEENKTDLVDYANETEEATEIDFGQTQSLCEQNPNHAGCQPPQVVQHGNDGFGGVSFNGGGNSHATGTLDVQGDDSMAYNPTTNSRADVPDSLSDDLASFGQSGSGGVHVGAAGDIKYAATPRSGGGGSGVSDMSVSPSGGGGGSRGGSAGSKDLAMESSKKGYSKKGSYGAAFRKSKGKKKKKKKKKGNAFANMFKKKSKTKDQELLQFRGLASSSLGSKKDNIFARITKRYKKVEKQNRLLEYEKK